jgi:hypothetical protein
MASIRRMAGGLGNFLLSLMVLWFSELGGSGRAPVPSPVTETVHLGSAANAFHATASVEHVGKGKVWTLRLELRDRESRAARQSE